MSDTDDFDAIVSGLDLDESDATSDDVVDVSSLNPIELNQTYNKCRQELLERQEMLNPTTSRGRELHSLRAACAIAMRKQGLK